MASSLEVVVIKQVFEVCGRHGRAGKQHKRRREQERNHRKRTRLEWSQQILQRIELKIYLKMSIFTFVQMLPNAKHRKLLLKQQHIEK